MTHGALPGFRDFYPEQFAEREYVMKVWREVARRYAFVEYDGPPLESLNLYTQKSGDEIVDQLYHFTDKGGREVALRPEMTPTLARMVAAKVNALRKPVRWFSVPQLFRYERAQRGRLREHFQLNVDILGEADVTADAELLAIAIDIMRELGLSPQDVRARISDRRLVRAILIALGASDETVPAIFGVLDKIGRLPSEEVANRLAATGLDSSAVEQVLSFSSRAVETTTTLRDALARIDAAFPSSPDVHECVERLAAYVGYLEHLGVADWVTLDLSIVRGLAYYTGIVFELFDSQGALRAICGGGRYDNLLGAFGNSDLPALGFGMGDVVLTELLRERGLNVAITSPDFWVTSAAEDGMADVMTTATVLRRARASVEYALRKQQIGKQRKAAMSAGASYFVKLADDFDRSGAIEISELLSAEGGGGAATPSSLMLYLANLPSTLESLVTVLREHPGVLV